MSERFLEGDINYKGNNFEFIPFGAGRIICSGLPFAHRTASNWHCQNPVMMGKKIQDRYNSRIEDHFSFFMRRRAT